MIKRIILILVLSCIPGCRNSENTDILEKYSYDQIPPHAIERLNDGFFYVIKFANLIYEVNDKKIIVPIFNGDMKSVKYNDFLKYCREKKMLDNNAKESSFLIKAEKGVVKKTFLEMIKFYENNILKGYENTYEMFPVGGDNTDFEWLIIYKIKIDSIPYTLKFTVTAYEKDPTLKGKFKNLKIQDIHPDERSDSFIGYEIYENYWE